MTTLVIDGKAYAVEARGRNLLEVCLSLGLNVPYFCWHPAFRSVGACRQCAVRVFKDGKDTRGRIEMSCLVPVTEGMRVSIDDPEAVAFRRKVIEWLMINHPHDCPVCDEGGECHLQDMTVMTGHVYRRYRFKKRTHRNQDLGPFVNMEMNRCIQCYRCVRFYRDYAGGRDFDVLGWHDHVYFGRHHEGTLESEFSGNLVEVCPTGVFTDKSLKRHYTRKWDLQTAPSICVHCGLGCNTIPGERYGMLRRIMPRFNGEVNGYFLCDRGRYGYEFVNSDRRIRQPLARTGTTLAPASREEALRRVSELLRTGQAIGIGSPRASLESNYALRALVGSPHFYHGVPGLELSLMRTMIGVLRRGPARTPSLHEVQSCDAVFVLGEDVTHSAPMLDLSIRQSILQKPLAEAKKLEIYDFLDACLREAIGEDRGPLFIATPDRTKLDALATAACRAAPADIARLGLAVAHEIDSSAPPVPDLGPEHQALARRIAAALKAATRPLVVSGSSCASEAVVCAAASVASALCRAGVDARLCFTVPECNSLGAALMPGGGLDAALAEIRERPVATVVILENDLHRRLDPESLAALLGSARHIIVLDHLTNATTQGAEIVLPCATFAEASGTFINSEGRAQRFFQVFAPAGDVQPSWRWLGDVMAAGAEGGVGPWPTLDDLLARLATELLAFADVPGIAPPAGFRVVGQKIPRQPARYSGRTAIAAHLDVHEPSLPDDPDTALSFSMEGFDGQPPPPLTARFWAPQWNSAQAINKFQIEVGGPLHGGDPGRRLIEPQPNATPEYPTAIPPPFAARPGEWLLLPAFHIHGSDELSILSPGVAERAPQPCLTLGPEDAALLGLDGGQQASLSLDGRSYALPVVIHPGVPVGVAMVPAGLPGLPGVTLPSWGKLSVEAKR